MLDVDRIKRKDVEVVYLGFDFEKMSPNVDDRMSVRREFGFADSDFVIGYVAQFANGKGHVQLIEAFEKILANVPDAKLFFVGSRMLDEVSSCGSEIFKRPNCFCRLAR